MEKVDSVVKVLSTAAICVYCVNLSLCWLLYFLLRALQVTLCCHLSCQAQTATHRDRRRSSLTKEQIGVKGPEVNKPPQFRTYKLQLCSSHHFVNHHLYFSFSVPQTQKQSTDENTPCRPKRQRVAGSLYLVCISSSCLMLDVGHVLL